jgi:hypothetical protein
MVECEYLSVTDDDVGSPGDSILLLQLFWVTPGLNGPVPLPLPLGDAFGEESDVHVETEADLCSRFPPTLLLPALPVLTLILAVPVPLSGVCNPSVFPRAAARCFNGDTRLTGIALAVSASRSTSVAVVNCAIRDVATDSVPLGLETALSGCFCAEKLSLADRCSLPNGLSAAAAFVAPVAVPVFAELLPPAAAMFLGEDNKTVFGSSPSEIVDRNDDTDSDVDIKLGVCRFVFVIVSGAFVSTPDPGEATLSAGLRGVLLLLLVVPFPLVMVMGVRCARFKVTRFRKIFTASFRNGVTWCRKLREKAIFSSSMWVNSISSETLNKRSFFSATAISWLEERLGRASFGMLLCGIANAAHRFCISTSTYKRLLVRFPLTGWKFSLL